MTKQGRSPFKPRTTGAGRTEGAPARAAADAEVTAQTRAAALRYLERTGNADVAGALGLVPDPVAERARRNKALIDMGGKSWPPCGICGGRTPKSGICRKTLRCRDAAARKELKELEEQ